MPVSPKDEIRTRLEADATNSSHFMWLIGRFDFFTSANGWVFGYVKKGSIILLALEPLVPGEKNYVDRENEFALAWPEFTAHTGGAVFSFVGINDDFMRLLGRHGFQSLKIGEDPWMELGDHLPRGNAGKGVRAARNKAVRHGAYVEEWDLKALTPAQRGSIEEIHRIWRRSTAVQLNGFLLATDPFSLPECRRLFVVRTTARVEGYLITTPIQMGRSFYFEDLIARIDAVGGCTELLTLSAMEALHKDGVKEISLGVISLNTLEFVPGERTARGLRYGVMAIRGFLKAFYNSEGIELFRKRFKPKHWHDVYLSAGRGDGKPVSGAHWLRLIAATISAFEPKIRPTPESILYPVLKPIRRHPVSITWGTLLLVLFGTVNRFGDLPQKYYLKFGFRPDVPVWEWFYRTFTNDVLCPNRDEFIVLFSLSIGVLFLLEERLRPRTVALLLLSLSFCDDFINYLLVIKPLQLFHGAIFERLVRRPEVGSSLIVSALLGIAVNQIGKSRELLLVLGSVVTVFALVYTSPKMFFLVLNLHYFLFFVGGYLVGKALFEWAREHSRQVAKGKAPKALSK